MNKEIRRVEGAVSDLSVVAGQQEFLQARGKTVAAAVGVGLAASGVAGLAVGTTVAATGAGDSVEYFSCRIGDVPVVGAFSKVTFKDGDVVVAAVDGSSGDDMVARGVSRVEDSTLWMESHCSRGSAAHLRRSFFVGAWVVLFFMAVSLPLLWMLSGDDARSTERVEYFAMVYTIVAMIAGGYYTVRFYFQWRKIARHAEDIFRCLGFAQPSTVDLPRENARCSRALGVPWPYNTQGPWIYRCVLPEASSAGIAGIRI